MAGAGSGKTSVLAERFAWLLESGRAQIEEVLCLTFTRKATAEMVEKIYRRLRDSGVPEVRQQLARFDQAQISTLDSFCSQIVRGACQRFGLPPDFRTDEEATRAPGRRDLLPLPAATTWTTPPWPVCWNGTASRRVAEEVFVELALRHLPLGEEHDWPGMAERQVRALEEGWRERLAAWQEAGSGPAGHRGRATPPCGGTRTPSGPAATWPRPPAPGASGRRPRRRRPAEAQPGHGQVRGRGGDEGGWWAACRSCRSRWP